MEYEYELEQCGAGKGKKKTVKASSTKTAPVEVVPERPKRLTDSLREAVAEADEIAAGLDRMGDTQRQLAETTVKVAMASKAIQGMTTTAAPKALSGSNAQAAKVEVLSPTPKSLTAQLREATRSLDEIQAGLDRMGEAQQQLMDNNKTIATSAKKLGLI